MANRRTLTPNETLHSYAERRWLELGIEMLEDIRTLQAYEGRSFLSKFFGRHDSTLGYSGYRMWLRRTEAKTLLAILFAQ